MNSKKINLRFGVISLLILLAGLIRVIPHPANFSPIGAMALFGAAYYSKKYWAFIIPIFAMWISDLILNNVIYSAYFDHFVWFYSGSLFTYGAFALIVLLGMFTLKKVRTSKLIISALGASAIFYLVSNFGVWFSSGMYPHTISGLGTCYVAGLAFLKNTIVSDFFYSGVLFGLFELSVKRFPILQLQKVSI